MSVQLLGPSTSFGAQIQAAPSGTNYQIGATGLVTVTNLADVPFLIENGFVLLAAGTGGLLLGGVVIGKLIGANMNSTADQPFLMFQPAALRFRVTKITAENASISLTTAVGGIYRAATKGGTPMVAAAQAYSALTSGTLAVDLTLATATTVEPQAEQIYLSLTTAQGAAATADLYMMADVYG